MAIAHQIMVKGDFFKKYYWTGEYTHLTLHDINRMQRARLERLIQFALNHSNFYRELYQDHGISLQDLKDINLNDLPIVDKNMLMDNFNAVVTDKRIKKEHLLNFIADKDHLNDKYKDNYWVIHSSGSSGNIGVFIYDERDVNAINVLFVKYIFHVEPLLKMLPQRVAFVGAINGHYAAYTAISRFRDYHIRFLPVSVETPLNYMIKALNDYQPSILVVYSSILSKLAQAQMDGQLNIRPRAINCGGELLTAPQAAIAKEAFGIAPQSIYGASESIIIGAHTVFNDGMYLFNNWNIMETLDEHDQPVPSGTYGRGVLSNLYNYLMPTIRYRMDDILSIDRNPADKHLPFEIIKGIEGRTEEFLEFSVNGQDIAIHPLIFVDFYVEGLRQIQVIKDRDDHFTARISLLAPQESIVKAARERLQEILDSYQAGGLVGFDIEVVDDIPNDSRTGKYKLIVNAFK